MKINTSAAMAISSVTIVITGASHAWSPNPSSSRTWPANCEPNALSPSDTTIATPRPASDPRSFRVATTKLSTVALSSSNSGRQIALVALRRLPIQPMPEYSAISRPTIPTPSGFATTLSISPVMGAASSAGSTSATWFSSSVSNS